MAKNKQLIKMFLAFFLYFLYSNYAISIGNKIGINSDLTIMFVADIIFMIFIIFMYRQNLKDDFKALKKDYSVWKIIKVVIFWFIIFVVINALMGAITDMIVPGFETDDNTNALYNVSTSYMIFKTAIFGIIAEELLYRESISTIIDQKVLFIFISAVVYTIMHFVFTGFPAEHLLIYIAMYFIPAIFFSLAYVKNKNNILVLMIIKFVYNLLPLTILLLGI